MTRALAIACVVLGIASAVLLAAWRHDHAKLAAARAAAEGRAEAERVEKAGVIAAAQASQAEADKQRRALEAESATFKAESERQLAAAKGRIETLLKLRTGVLVASGDVKPPGPPDPTPGPPDTCLLAVGDQGDILARVSTVRYEHGTLSVAGDAEAARIDSDGSRHVLLAGAWSAERSAALEIPRETVTQRARFSVQGGVTNPFKPSGGYGGAGVRVVGPIWVEALGLVDDGRALALAGVRWELR